MVPETVGSQEGKAAKTGVETVVVSGNSVAEVGDKATEIDCGEQRGNAAVEAGTEPEGSKTAQAVEVGAKVIKGSFWVIAAIHIAVFTTIGAATGRWRLLVVFLIGFVLTLAAYAGLKIWLAKRSRAEKQ